MNDSETRPAFTGPTVGALRTFAYWIAAGTAGLPLLEGVDYWQVLHEEPSLMEQVFAIFGNVLRVDSVGMPVNARAAERRAAQYIRQYVTGEQADPDWQTWEVEILQTALTHPPCPVQDDEIEDVTCCLEILRSRVTTLARSAD